MQVLHFWLQVHLPNSKHNLIANALRLADAGIIFECRFAVLPYNLNIVTPSKAVSQLLGLAMACSLLTSTLVASCILVNHTALQDEQPLYHQGLEI